MEPGEAQKSGKRTSVAGGIGRFQSLTGGSEVQPNDNCTARPCDPNMCTHLM